ncbi:MAG: leucyl/phenylalanyl-tRNA--protein transferase [Saprospiraceae bacterium]|nr:leucyl/phenylalanyl-tRNA--protein transferase [Saprospiraceae bacterium]
MQEYKLNESHYLIPDLADGIYDGLLMVGGSLEFEQLLVAYLNGIFPWYNEGQQIMWFAPIPRLVLFPKKLKIAKSLKLLMKKNIFQYSVDCNFLDVMLQCKTVARHGEHGSWIHGDIIQAFSDLHEKGLAHSLEIWKDGDLVGGLYGLALGNMFCGESMFFKESNASKIALAALCIELIRRKFKFIDCQQDTPHMKSMGAELLELEEFQNLLEQNKKHALIGQSWKQDPRPITSDDLMQFT